MKKKIDGRRSEKKAIRIADIKRRIRDRGIDRLPTYKEMAKEYEVSLPQIQHDIDEIITQMDPRELDETFTNFYQTDLRALEVIKLIIHNGNYSERVKAINALVNLQEGITKLLENYSRKQKVADKLAIEQVSYNFKIERPEEKEMIIDVQPSNKREEESEDERD